MMTKAGYSLALEIRLTGPVPFQRFMEVALGCPNAGYYEQISHTPGRRGDFFTNVSVGPVFGQLLARQFCRWAREREWSAWRILEGGGADGGLARDLLGWIGRHRPRDFERLEYVLVEPSERRRMWQRETLADFAGRVGWAADWDEIGGSSVTGVVFANELLDALPVARLGWDAAEQGWFEWGVGLERDRFIWKRLAHDRSLPPAIRLWIDEVGSGLGRSLPDGFSLEVSPAALAWWSAAAGALLEGCLLTLDYGLEAADWLSPARPTGTLRAYRAHRQCSDPLADPGEQDLTAHVNWTLLQKAGEGQGLTTRALRPQGRWLTQILAESSKDDSSWAGLSPSEARQFQTLVHPEQLGARFQVLVQSREK